MEHNKEIQQRLEIASQAQMLDMTVANEPELKHLYAERVALDARIREMQRTAALEKGLAPITSSDIQEVLRIIFLSSAEDTKRGMVQKKAPGKADVYSRVLDYRITPEIAQAIPKRYELEQVFGDYLSALVAPVGSKINQIIPRVRCLLNAAADVLALRAALNEANAEIQDCHDQIGYGLGLSAPTKSTRGRRSKLSPCEVQDIARMKQELSNQAVLKQVNESRAEFGEPPVGLTAIKEIPTLVAKQRISDQTTTPEPKALSHALGGAAVHTKNQSDSDMIRVPTPSVTDALSMAEEIATREVWGVDEKRGIGFDKIGRHKPSRLEQQYSRKFNAWKEGLNI